MRKLKSSMKSLKEFITSFKPTAPSCIQEAKTNSFRSVVHPSSSFRYLHSTPSPSSSLPSSRLRHHPPSTHPENSPPSSSSSSSSSSFTAAKARENEQEENLLPNDRINPKRFFFAPCNTKSIMEEMKEDCAGGNLKVITGKLYEESEAMAVASDNPYKDFKNSMAEMVEAHKLREWSELQELLHCYLDLNDKKTHKIIVLAFVDMLMHLMANERENFSFFSAPLCPLAVLKISH